MTLPKMEFTVPTGLRDETAYPTRPGSSAAAREQVQGRLDELKNYLNNDLTEDVDAMKQELDNTDTGLSNRITTLENNAMQAISSKKLPTVNDDDKTVSSIWTIPSTLPSQLTNILETYGNFETDSNSDGLADGWIEVNAATTKSLDSTIKKFGSKSQKFTCGAADIFSYDISFPTMIAGHKYYIAGWNYTTDFQGSSNSMNFRINAGATQKYSGPAWQKTDSPTLNQWVKVSTLYTSDGTEDTLKLVLGGAGANLISCTTYFDGVIIVDVTDITDITETEANEILESLGEYFDNTIDYSKGTGRSWICVSNAADAAVWKEISFV